VGDEGMGDEEAEPMREREREREGERRVRWKYGGVEIFITWWCLEEGKKFLSASGFNLDYRL
jgi:hypothetical protein